MIGMQHTLAAHKTEPTVALLAGSTRMCGAVAVGETP